ncbi:MAG: adenylate/guanylate cyclase domain-containing protein [Deltaproteobacteria bacterium]|nr:adenylate/guanylate cyclase domain-containing protein [Deltaproteobacteria bacterium]
MPPRARVTLWMVAASLVAAAALVVVFAFETTGARRARLLAEGRRVALSAVTLYDVLRLTGSAEDRATLVSFVQAAVRGTEAEDELVFLEVRDASGALVASEGSAAVGGSVGADAQHRPGVLEVRATVVARDRGGTGSDMPAGSVVVGLSTEPGARELGASIALGGGAALLGALGLALALTSLVRRRVIAPAELELSAERGEQERLHGVLARHVGDQRARAVVAGDRAQQRKVTVLTVNVVDFLPLLQRQPPAATLHLLDELYATTCRVVLGHGGHVEKMLGDTVQCLWGVAGARPDDELEAVAAGLELQQEVEVLARARKERGDEPFAVGIGIATGEAVVGTVGGRARAETVVVGEVTALAAALEEEARAHRFGLVVAEETYAQVSAQYEGAASPPTLVHGIGVPLTFYRVRPRRNVASPRAETTDPVRRAARARDA